MRQLVSAHSPERWQGNLRRQKRAPSRLLALSTGRCLARYSPDRRTNRRAIHSLDECHELPEKSQRQAELPDRLRRRTADDGGHQAASLRLFPEAVLTAQSLIRRPAPSCTRRDRAPRSSRKSPHQGRFRPRVFLALSRRRWRRPRRSGSRRCRC